MTPGSTLIEPWPAVSPAREGCRRRGIVWNGGLSWALHIAPPSASRFLAASPARRIAAADEAAAVPSTQPTTQELLDKVARLESKVQKLEAERGENAPDVRRKVAQLESMVQKLESEQTDVQATRERVKAAAEASPLSLGTVNTRFNNGSLELSTSDGEFRLHPMFHFVFRDNTNFRDHAAGPFASENSDNGFEIRRMEFGAEGNVFSKDLSYLFLWDTDRHNGRPILELAFAQYQIPNSPWSIRGGQIKEPFDKEQLGGSAEFVAVERTLVVDTLAGGDAFTHGLSLIYDNNGPFRSEVALTDGFASANQTFQDYPTNVADWGAAARVEYKLFGDWGQYHAATALGNKKDLMVLGGGLDYSESAPRPPSATWLTQSTRPAISASTAPISAAIRATTN